MLRNSFIFLPRIGEVRERRLWRSGVLDWDAYRDVDLDDVRGVGEETRARHLGVLDELDRALRARAWPLVGRVFPDREHWRVYPELRDGAVYLDIETTGTGRDADVTVVGLKGPLGEEALVRGRDLSHDAVARRLEEASMLVTFYGSAFDLPFLARAGYEVPDVPHLDLCFALRRAGYSGGLKSIETQLGLARDDDLQGLDGYDAVRLWARWVRDRDEAALDRLVRYNIADIANLEVLAETAYEELHGRTLGPFEEVGEEVGEEAVEAGGEDRTGADAVDAAAGADANGGGHASRRRRPGR